MDVVGSKLDLSQDAKFKEAIGRKVYFSPVYFRKESEPYMTISLAGTGEDAGVVAAEANLKLIWDVVSNLKVGKGGYAYVVDNQGRLIAHPDISLVLQEDRPVGAAAGEAGEFANRRRCRPCRGSDLRPRSAWQRGAVRIGTHRAAQLARARRSADQRGVRAAVRFGRSHRSAAAGRDTHLGSGRFAADAPAGPADSHAAGGRNEDRRRRIGPSYRSSRPEMSCKRWATSSTRWPGGCSSTHAGLEQKVEERTRDLREALEQQTATSDVLKAISRATFDLQAVLTTLVASAIKLCHAQQGGMFRLKDGVYQWAAGFGLDGEYLSRERAALISPGRGTVVGRAALERQTVQIVDALADPDYAVKEDARVGGVRSMLGVPLIRGDVVVGVVALARTRAEPFTPQQVELVTTFADQALIAIENVRLLQELQDRNDALTESLEQQTATSEILRTISSSPANLQPVLDAVVENAGRLADASECGLMRVQDGFLVVAAEHRSKGDTSIGEQIPIRRDTVGGRAVIDAKTVHVADIVAESGEFAGGKNSKTREGLRTMLAVPMLREGSVIGVLGLARNEIRPFSDKQIELVQTFADQAVIAIENVRLFQELQSRTGELAHSVEQFKALAEVSHAVNSSLDLSQVLANIVARAVQLSASDSGAVYEYDESKAGVAAAHHARAGARVGR